VELVVHRGANTAGCRWFGISGVLRTGSISTCRTSSRSVRWRGNNPGKGLAVCSKLSSGRFRKPKLRFAVNMYQPAPRFEMV